MRQAARYQEDPYALQVANETFVPPSVIGLDEMKRFLHPVQTGLRFSFETTNP